MRFFFILRSVLATICFSVVTLVICSSTLFFSFFTTSSKISNWHIKTWGQIACWLYGVEVRVHGLENWKAHSGGVVLFNHTSFFDIFAMVGFLPEMRFGAKIELFKIPLFGSAMKRVGMLPIDRNRKEKAFAIFQEAVDRLKAGERIALAPEGKRTSSPQHLLPFKSGPFIFALQARVELMPVVIKGAFEVMPKGHWLPNTTQASRPIDLYILKPIKTDHIVQEKKSELQEAARSEMQKVLESNVVNFAKASD